VENVTLHTPANPLNAELSALLDEQNGRCTVCGDELPDAMQGKLILQNGSLICESCCPKEEV
jgi:hypothetical protein